MSNRGKGQGHSKPPKFTAQELMDLHGLSVEQAIAKGYEVVGQRQKKATGERQLRRRQKKIIQLNYNADLQINQEFGGNHGKREA